MELGFRTILVDDCSRGIDETDIKNSFDKIRSQNGLVVQSHEVRAMVQVCYLLYTGSLHIATFGSGRKLCYAKFVLVQWRTFRFKVRFRDKWEPFEIVCTDDSGICV